MCKASTASSAGLEGHDVQVVALPVVVCGRARGRGRVEDVDSGTLGPDGVGLRGVVAPRTDTVGGCSSGNSREAGLGGVADGAVLTGPSDADIVVLAGQMVLGGRHGSGAGVPVKTRNGP